MKQRGNCYVASEAVYHILGGKIAGWTPMRMRIGNDTHWFLRHKSGMVIDISRRQFKTIPDYKKAVGSGFLTKQPSKRAKMLIQQLTYQKEQTI